VSFLDFIDALRAMRAAEFGELEAEASLSTRHAALARALGETAGLQEEPR
jgi:hypothetical protein